MVEHDTPDALLHLAGHLEYKLKVISIHREMLLRRIERAQETTCADGGCSHPKEPCSTVARILYGEEDEDE